jgi:hypothetical protein
MVPLARPGPGAAEPAPIRPTGPPFETDGQRYFGPQDPEAWTEAVRDFALGLVFERSQESSVFRLEWYLEEILDQVDSRLEEIVESRPDLDHGQEEALALDLIEKGLLERLEGLAIDEEGRYFVMFRDGDEWLDTPVSAGRGNGDGRFHFQDREEAENIRHGAATRAWRNRLPAD